MGIDYGEKRVGIASTDDSGTFALPRTVVPNDDTLVDYVLDMLIEDGIERVVIGESKNYKGEENPIMSEARVFAASLQEKGLDVVFHPELMTSMEAERLQGSNSMNDASAAALILKSYIDTHDHHR